MNINSNISSAGLSDEIGKNLATQGLTHTSDKKATNDRENPLKFIDSSTQLRAAMEKSPDVKAAKTKIWAQETSRVMAKQITQVIKKILNNIATFLHQKLPAFNPIRKEYTTLANQAHAAFIKEPKAGINELNTLRVQLDRGLKKLDKLSTLPDLFSEEKNKEIGALKAELRTLQSNITGQLQIQQRKKAVANLPAFTRKETPHQMETREHAILSNPALPQNLAAALALDSKNTPFEDVDVLENFDTTPFADISTLAHVVPTPRKGTSDATLSLGNALDFSFDEIPLHDESLRSFDSILDFSFDEIFLSSEKNRLMEERVTDLTNPANAAEFLALSRPPSR